MRIYRLDEAYSIKHVRHTISFKCPSVVSLYSYLSEYDRRTTFKPTYKEYISKLASIRREMKLRNAQNNQISIINLLIGNKKLYNKVYFVTDGSYRKNRIYIVNNNIELINGHNNNEFYYLCSIEKEDIKQLFKEYKVVFIHIV